MKNKCLLCPKPATKGVYCASCSNAAQTKFASTRDAAPNGTFKKTTVGRARVITAGRA